MKKKRIASKLLSLLLAAAVIVSSSFSGITLMDVSATQAAEETVAVSVSQNEVSEMTEVTEEDMVTVSENDAEMTEEATEDVEPVTEETADEPEEEIQEPVWDSSMEEAKVVTDPQPYVSAERYSASKISDEDLIKKAELPISYEENGEYATSSMTAAVVGTETTLGVEEEPVQAVAPERATTQPADSTLVTNLVAETAMANALLKIYNEKKSASLTLSSFKYSHLKAITGTVDLSTSPYKSSITKATGIGHLVNATEINLTGTKITFIPGSEFWHNSKLVTITLPDTVVGFGDSAFNGCTALVNIHSSVANNTLPSYLDDEKMGSSIFANCTALKTIAIPSMKNDAYALRPATSMFNGCTALTTVTVGANVAVIPNSCFVGAGDESEGLTVTFATGSVLDTLMDSAFQYCNISELDLSKCSKLARIGVRCFTPRQAIAKKSEGQSEIALRKLILPAANSTINANGLEIAEEAFFQAPLATVCVGSYTESANGKVVLPNYVKSIGVAAFYGNEAMTSLQLSAKLPLIPKFAFAECVALNNVTVDVANNGNVCETVGIADQAFQNTRNLTSAAFLANMTKLSYIGEEKWDVTDDKKEPEVKIIDYYSYKTDGYNKKYIYFSAVFSGSGIMTASLPKSLRTIGAGAFKSAESLVTVTWAADPNLAATAKYEIGSMAFATCPSLTTFKHPNTGTVKASFEIWPYAFAYCESLADFSSSADTDALTTNNAMPLALTRLGLLSFASCEALQYMKITNNAKGVSPTIEKAVFALCRGLEQVELPKATTVIPAQMFYDCSLTAFPTFNGGVALEAIGDAAFFGNRMTQVDLSAYTKLWYIGVTEFAYHDPYIEAEDEDGNPIIVVADEILTTVNEVKVAETTLAPLTTLILPDAINGKTVNLVLEDSMLQMAGKFTTLKTKSRGVNGQVYIPNYVMQKGVGNSIFAGTAVTKATWEFETMASGANAWNAIPDGMFAFTPITDISTCSFAKSKVAAIGSCAYAGTMIEELDLTTYPVLSKLGDGVFALCPNLAEVKLPNNGICVKVPDGAFLVGDFVNEVGLEIVDKDVVFSSALNEIDFGKVTEIGKYAFATTDYTKKVSEIGADYADALETLDLSKTMVVTIDEGAFAGNTSLRSINLGKVKTLGGAAFRACTNLVLTYDINDATKTNPLGSALQSIGDYAFHLCTDIGEVVFGPQLQSIGESAFDACIIADEEEKVFEENSGLTSVDFSKATKLATIGKNAFRDTNIKHFDISKTKVVELKEGAVGSCPLLETITLSESVQKVAANAAYGCISLGSFEFYSTTTVDLKAFYKKGNYKGVDDNDQIVYITPISKVDFRITPVELNVGLGNPMKFPYYVNDKKNGSGEFGEIVIGQASVGNENPTVHQYIKVMANTSKYYKNNTDPSNIVTDSKYFEKTDAIEYKVNNTTVYTFEIQGLKATPANTTVPFSVTSGYTFTADGDVSAEQKLTAKYNLKVLEIPYYPTFYTDKDRLYGYGDLKVNEATGVTTGTSNIRACVANPTGRVTLYYDITPLYKTNWRPETGNLVVKTSNPDIISFATGPGMTKVDDKTYKMTAEPGKTETTLSALTSGKKLVVVPKKQGSATVTVYHEDCPSKKVTWNINVKVDIKEILVSIPSAYSKGVYEGDNFQIMSKITFFVGGSVTRSAGTLDTYKQYTDNTITFYSNDTSWATLDSKGILTIKKSSKSLKPLVFGCIVTRPDGTKMIEESKIDIKYPTFATGKAARTSTGDQVKITKKASGKKLAEVSYVAPANPSKTSVTIPSTVTVGGVKCKVTSMAAGAFEGNKKLKSVTIGKYITKIPKNAFKGCTKLTKVTFKGKITEIGESAFEKCTSLKKITIPKTVTKIGKKAFASCKKLTTVTFAKKSKLKEIGESAFYGCKSMKTIKIISTSLTKIGVKAFYKCSKLKKIVVKSTKVTSVGKNAFKGIYKKAVIDVPNSKLSKYKTLFKKGQGSKVKIK